MAILGAKTFQNYIGGEWVDAASGETFESTSPANGDAIGTFPRSSRGGRRARSRRREGGLRGLAPRPGAEARRDPLPLRAAPDRAEGGPLAAHGPRDGQGPARGARRRPGSDRHGLLHGRRGPAPVRPDDARPSSRDKFNMSVRQPIGVVGVITPWNFPIAIPSLEDPARARLREHRRLQARDRHADARRALRRAADRGGRSRRRRQRRPRGRGRGRQRDRHATPTCR